MLNAKNGLIRLKDGEMDYIRFGYGSRKLVMIPGVGDGLKTVHGVALPFALLYRAVAKEFTVYVFSRRRELHPGMTTREMAEDLNRAMNVLDLTDVSMVGVSQGGMIAQWLAIDHPEKVKNLVLTVTLSRPNDTVKDVTARWIKMAENGDYKGIMLDTAERSYSEKRLRKTQFTWRILGNLGKPSSFERFIIQAESCTTHDAYEELPRISCPTLVIGGRDDKIVTGEASEEIAGRISGSRLLMYDHLGHGLYEEAPDFLQQVMRFCGEE